MKKISASLNEHVYLFLFFASSLPRCQAEFLTYRKKLKTNLYWEGRGAIISSTDADVDNWCGFVIQWNALQQHAASIGIEQFYMEKKHKAKFFL